MAKDEEFYQEVRFPDGTYLSDKADVDAYRQELPVARSMSNVVEVLKHVDIDVALLQQIETPKLATMVTVAKEWLVEGREFDVELIQEPDIIFNFGQAASSSYSYWFTLDVGDEDGILIEARVGNAAFEFDEQSKYYNLCVAQLRVNTGSAGQQEGATATLALEIEKLKLELVEKLLILAQL